MLFSISEATCRNWSREFERHLSVTAAPGPGRHRNFTQGDLEVFALIQELKDQGMTYEDIHVALENGQRGDPPILPVEEIEALVVSEQQKQIAQQLRQLQENVLRLEAERDAALARVRPVEDENVRLKALLESAEESARQRIDELNEQLERAQKRIEDLNREVITSYG